MPEETTKAAPREIPWDTIGMWVGSGVLTICLTVLVALSKLTIDAYMPSVFGAWGLPIGMQKLKKKEAPKKVARDSKPARELVT